MIPEVDEEDGGSVSADEWKRFGNFGDDHDKY